MQILFSWLTPLFVDRGGTGHIAGMQHLALKEKKKHEKHKAVCKHWELLKQKRGHSQGRRAKELDPLPCHAGGLKGLVVYGFPTTGS